ncbi:hypothetical protein PM015_17940, partial [Halorubrum ezzemoulense]|uniref:hypothetical protein n=1 Tax=Halorubrum ezzemoulense TaxID=337243 RepID=UPI00232E4E57
MSGDDFDDDLIDDDIVEETTSDDDHVKNTVQDDEDGSAVDRIATTFREGWDKKSSTAQEGLSDARDALEPRAKAAGERAGELAGRGLGVTVAFVVSLVSTGLYTLTKFLPFIGEKFWKSAIETCVV